MATFEFTLTVRPIERNEGLLDRLYEAGCSDALVSVIDNEMVLDFARESASLVDAVISAINDVARGGACVIKASVSEPRREYA